MENSIFMPFNFSAPRARYGRSSLLLALFYACCLPAALADTGALVAYPSRPLKVSGVHAYLPPKHAIPPIFTTQLKRKFIAYEKLTGRPFACVVLNALPDATPPTSYAQALAAHWHFADAQDPRDGGVLFVLDAQAARGAVVWGGKVAATCSPALRHHLTQKFLTKMLPGNETGINHERLQYGVKKAAKVLVSVLTGERTEQAVLTNQLSKREKIIRGSAIAAAFFLLVLLAMLWRTRHRKGNVDPDIAEVERWLVPNLAYVPGGDQ